MFSILVGMLRRPTRPTGCSGGSGFHPVQSLMAYCARSPISTHSRVEAWVDSSTTRGAMPASKASCQREAQRHYLTPIHTPLKWCWGWCVERSLPTEAEKDKNSTVARMHTVCTPKSSAPVEQH